MGNCVPKKSKKDPFVAEHRGFLARIRRNKFPKTESHGLSMMIDDLCNKDDDRWSGQSIHRFTNAGHVAPEQNDDSTLIPMFGGCDFTTEHKEPLQKVRVTDRPLKNHDDRMDTANSQDKLSPNKPAKRSMPEENTVSKYNVLVTRPEKQNPDASKVTKDIDQDNTNIVVCKQDDDICSVVIVENVQSASTASKKDAVVNTAREQTGERKHSKERKSRKHDVNHKSTDTIKLQVTNYSQTTPKQVKVKVKSLEVLSVSDAFKQLDMSTREGFHHRKTCKDGEAVDILTLERQHKKRQKFKGDGKARAKSSERICTSTYSDQLYSSSRDQCDPSAPEKEQDATHREYKQRNKRQHRSADEKSSHHFSSEYKKKEDCAESKPNEECVVEAVNKVPFMSVEDCRERTRRRFLRYEAEDAGIISLTSSSGGGELILAKGDVIVKDLVNNDDGNNRLEKKTRRLRNERVVTDEVAMKGKEPDVDKVRGGEYSNFKTRQKEKRLHSGRSKRKKKKTRRHEHTVAAHESLREKSVFNGMPQRKKVRKRNGDKLIAPEEAVISHNFTRTRGKNAWCAPDVADKSSLEGNRKNLSEGSDNNNSIVKGNATAISSSVEITNTVCTDEEHKCKSQENCKSVNLVSRSSKAVVTSSTKESLASVESLERLQCEDKRRLPIKGDVSSIPKIAYAKFADEKTAVQFQDIESAKHNNRMLNDKDFKGPLCNKVSAQLEGETNKKTFLVEDLKSDHAKEERKSNHVTDYKSNHVTDYKSNHVTDHKSNHVTDYKSNHVTDYKSNHAMSDTNQTSHQQIHSAAKENTPHVDLQCLMASRQGRLINNWIHDTDNESGHLNGTTTSKVTRGILSNANNKERRTVAGQVHFNDCVTVFPIPRIAPKGRMPIRRRSSWSTRARLYAHYMQRLRNVEPGEIILL